MAHPSVVILSAVICSCLVIGLTDAIHIHPKGHSGVIQPNEDHSFVNVDAEASVEVGLPPAALTANELILFNLWRGAGNVWPDLSTTRLPPLPGGPGPHPAPLVPAHNGAQVHVEPNNYMCVRNAMRGKDKGGRCGRTCSIAAAQQGCTTALIFTQLCSDFWCGDVLDDFNTRLNRVVASTVIGDVINRPYSLSHANCQNPSPEVAWDYLEYVVRSMSVGGVLRQLPIHFHAFAHVVEGDKDARTFRIGTYNGGGGHFINPLLTHLANDRFGGVSNAAGIQAVTHALNTAGLATAILVPPAAPGGGLIPHGPNLYPTWTAPPLTALQRQAIWHGVPANYVNAGAGPHVYQVVSAKRAANNVLFVGWNSYNQNDFLHAYAQIGPGANDWKTIWPEAWTPRQFLEACDAIRAAAITAYDLLAFAPLGGNHWKVPGGSFVAAQPHAYVYNGVHGGITFEMIFVEDALRVPVLNVATGLNHFAAPSVADLVSERSGITAISSVYPTMAGNFPGGILPVRAPANGVATVDDLDLTGVGMPQLAVAGNRVLLAAASITDATDRNFFG